MLRKGGKMSRVLAGALILALWAAFPVQALDAQPEGKAQAAPELVWPAAPLPARIRYVGAVSTPEDLGRQKGFWRKVWEFIRGEEEDERIVRPMSVVVDSKDRLIVADSAMKRVHVFDRKNSEYSAIRGSDQESLILPLGLVVDGDDRIYVADGERGKIYIFKPDGVFDKAYGAYSWLKRPTGLAIDRARKRLYVVDTPSHDIKVLDLTQGTLVQTIGRRGEAAGEFNFPTYVSTDLQGRLYVTDSLNARIQVFDAKGRFVSSFGKQGDGSGDFNAAKGVAVDGEGHIYVADAGFDNVQIFDAEGKLLLYWGASGQGPGKFWLPTGLFIDGQNRIYVADSYNNRVQIFQYLGKQAQVK